MCNGMVLSHKKNEILPFGTTWMELEGIMQTEKEKYHIIHLYVESKKEKKENEQTKRLTDTENKTLSGFITQFILLMTCM